MGEPHGEPPVQELRHLCPGVPEEREHGFERVTSYRFYAPKARDYRALAYGTTLVWGTTSNLMYR
jgi:hypothetical protein